MNFKINVHHKNIHFNFIFFIIITLLVISNNYIILPFKSIHIAHNEGNIKDDRNEIEKILSILNGEIIYTSISFGNPPSSIDFYFSMEKYLTYINQNICFKDSTSSYYPKNSETFKNINNYLNKEECSLYKDLNLTENITVNSFLFYLNNNIYQEKDFKDNLNESNYLKELNKYCGIIGLSRYPNNPDFNFKSFIYNLKNYDFINSYSFGFFFFKDNKKEDDYDGFFIAGVNSDDNIDIFENNLSGAVYAEENSLNWAINFERIFYYEKINGTLEYINTNNTKVEFIIDLNYIISDENYYEDLKKIYFKKFFENDTCNEVVEIVNGEYTHMIICNSNFKENMSSFPCIYFFIEQLFFAFNLCYEDLFFEYNGKIYFLILRKESIKNYWKIGKIFLKKFPLIFDYDKKIISYVYLNKHKWEHSKCLKYKEKLIDNNEQNSQMFNKEYLIYIFLIIGVFIGILIGKRIWNKNNKLKANELEEKYKYFETENNKNIDGNLIMEN